MGSASAVNLSQVKKEEVCYTTTYMRSNVGMVNGKYTATLKFIQIPANSLSLLDSIGVKMYLQEGCKYYLSGVAELFYAIGETRMAYTLEMSLFPDRPTASNAWMGKGLIPNANEDDINRMSNNLIYEATKLFVKDWKEAHKK